MKIKQSFFCCILLFLVSCRIPRDPEDTLTYVQNGTLRLGVTTRPPWVSVENDLVSGIEIQLIQGFARELSAKIDWVEGPEAEILQALEHFELDMAIGGLLDDSLWKSRVGLSRPYYQSKLIIASATEGIQLDQKPKPPVAVLNGSAYAARLQKKGFPPLRVPQVTPDMGLVLVYDWQAEKWGLHPTDIVIQKENHVLAAPPGENEFLHRLDKYLHAQRDSIPKMLTEGIAP